MKIKWVKKIERISDAGDVKESIYKPENGKGWSGISIETVKKAIRLQSGSRWETNSIKIHKAVLKTNYDTFEKACAAAERMMH